MNPSSKASKEQKLARPLPTFHRPFEIYLKKFSFVKRFCSFVLINTGRSNNLYLAAEALV